MFVVAVFLSRIFLPLSLRLVPSVLGCVAVHLTTAALPPSSFCLPAPARSRPVPSFCVHIHIRSINWLLQSVRAICVQISMSQSANFRMAPAPRGSRYFPFLYLPLPPFVSIPDKFCHFCRPFVYLSPDRLIDFRWFQFLFVMNLFQF